MFWYRYESGWSWMDETVLEPRLRQFRVVEATPKGVWLRDPDHVNARRDGHRWVSSTARKRFAYPTIELARESFQIRTYRRLQHLARMHDGVAAMLANIEAGHWEPKRTIGLPSWVASL